MRKKNINLKDEEARTEMFLEKLNKFKQGAKSIKEKTKSTVHKIEWVKEWQILERMESQLTADLYSSIKSIDLDCSDTLHSLDIFSDSKEGIKNLQGYQDELERKNNLNSLNLWFQVRNLKSLTDEVKKKNKEINAKTMRELDNDVKKFFDHMGEILNVEYKNIIRERESHSELIHQVINKKDEVLGFDKELDINLEIMLGDKRFISEEIMDSIIPMKENYYHALNLIDERYNLELENLSMDHTTTPAEMWTESMKEMFYHIYKTYIKRGKDRDVYMERLLLQFPGIPRKHLEAYDQYIVDIEYYNKKVKALLRDWEKEKQQMKSFAEEQILNQVEYLIRETENELAKLKTNKELVRIQQIIESQREDFEKRRQLIQEKEKREREEERKLKELKEQKFQEHAQEVKVKAVKYIDERNKIDEETRFIIIKEESRKKIEMKKAIEKNKPLVIIRQNKEIDKIKTKMEDKEKRTKDKEANLDRIEKAIESYSMRPVVERDFNRVIKETEALVSKKNTQLDKGDQVRLFPAHGFSVNELMKDMRYKISSALFDAGLQNTDYAKNLINRMSKPGQ